MLCFVACWACQGESASPGTRETTRLVLKMQPLWGDLAPFHGLLAQFSRENPGVEVAIELLPNASDLAHQYYLTALEGGASDFDVFVLDVVWVREFVRAGFLADLSDSFAASRVREDFLAGPAQVAIEHDHTFAVPWFVDVGVLYYRTDLVPRAPRTYAELGAFARAAMAHDPGLAGYLWQGKQYEGLSCNVYEAIWGHGGGASASDPLGLEGPAARAGLAYLRGLLRSGLSPPSVTSAGEEDARRAFQEGHAVFMRNWPYAWALLQEPGSRVRGKVGMAALPSASGEPGPGALGGFHLGVNVHVSAARRPAAARLVAHLSSLEANLLMASQYGRSPALREAYRSPVLAARAPLLAKLSPELERARPRPVTPYYLLLADILQSEFSAAVAGLYSPAEALERARVLSAHLTGEAP